MIRIDNLHVATDRGVDEREVRALGASFGRELHLALNEASSVREARIDTLSIELPAAAIRDRSGLRDAARRVARGIVERNGVTRGIAGREGIARGSVERTDVPRGTVEGTNPARGTVNRSSEAR